MEEQPQTPTKEPNIITGQIHYEISFDDKSYQIKFDRGTNPELAANMIAREGVKFAKQNLTASVSQAKGKDLDLIKDRLGKVTSCEYILGMIIEQIIGQMLMDKELKAENSSAEFEGLQQPEITPLEPIADDLTKDKSE